MISPLLKGLKHALLIGIITAESWKTLTCCISTYCHNLYDDLAFE